MIRFDLTLGGSSRLYKMAELAYYDDEEGMNVKGFCAYAWPFMLRVTWKVGGH